MKHKNENTFFTVFVPQIGVNDDSAVVVEYLFNEGDHVDKNDTLITVESTKSIIEIFAETSGYFLPCCEVGEEVGVNGELGYIFTSIEDLNRHKKSLNPKTIPIKHSNSEHRKILTSGSFENITKKAQSLISKYSLDVSSVKSESTILREKDVLRHLSLLKQKISYPEFDIKKTQVVIYGCGNGARTVMETLLNSSEYQVVGFIADRENHKTEIEHLPVLPIFNPDELKRQEIHNISLAITDSVKRLTVFRNLEKNNFKVINAVHSRSYISPTAKIGRGNHIKAESIIDTNSTLGSACIVDNNVTIPHDNIIEDGVHLAPGVTLGSSITVGRNSIIGIGSSISTDIMIGEYCIISVGSSVTMNVPDRSIVEGVPGKIIGTRKIQV